MPLKVCPKCEQGCGPRSKQCPSCSHEFGVKLADPKPKRIKRRTRELIGIGAWINDPPKDMPLVEQPEPLPANQKLTIDEISNYCAYEGLPFCVFEYIGSERIEDEGLARLWEDAKNRLSEVVSYIIEKEHES